MVNEYQRVNNRLNEIKDELKYFRTQGIGSPAFKLLGLASIGGGVHYTSKIVELAQQAYISNPNNESLSNIVLMGFIPAMMILGGAAVYYISHRSEIEDAKKKKALEDEARKIRVDPVYQSLERVALNNF